MQDRFTPAQLTRATKSSKNAREPHSRGLAAEAMEANEVLGDTLNDSAPHGHL